MSVEEARRVVTEVVRTGVTPEEVKATYVTWAATYDQDMSQLSYGPPQSTVQGVQAVCGERKDVKILDVASGTGLVGQMLHELGYKNVDAVDASREMLEVAEKKKVYGRLICDYVGTNRLDIEDNTYDVLASCGSFVPGHLNHECFPELIRITKPGGYIVMIVAAHHLPKVEFKEFEPSMQRHQDEGLWQRVAAYPIDKMFGDLDGKGYHFKVTKPSATGNPK